MAVGAANFAVLKREQLLLLHMTAVAGKIRVQQRLLYSQNLEYVTRGNYNFTLHALPNINFI